MSEQPLAVTRDWPIFLYKLEKLPSIVAPAKGLCTVLG